MSVRWIEGLLVAGALTAAPGVVHAEDDQLAAETAGALPGIVRVPLAGPVRRGAVFSASLGYGYTESVLSNADSHHRLLGTLAASFRPSSWLDLGLRLDGRFDSHVSAPEGDDSGAVGDPRLWVLATHALGNGFSGGARASLWLPGTDAPSITFGATTLDLDLLLTRRSPSFEALVLAAQLGFRIDQSAAAAVGADALSRADRLALGVSDANALLLGLGASYRLGRTELLGEWSWDLLVGGGAPGALESPMRVSLGARWPLDGGEKIWAQAIADLSTSGRPEVDRGRPLVPVEPRASLVASLVFRLPSASGEEHPIEVRPPIDTLPRLGGTGKLRGTVTDRTGAPVPAGEVRIAAVSQAAPIAAGAFELEGVDDGPIELIVEAKGFLSVIRPVTVIAGQVTQVDVALEPAPSTTGQLRGQVRSFSGRAIVASVRVEPLGTELVADKDGSFRVDVPPGAYTLVLKARGYATQRRAVQVEENGVTVLNVELVEGQSAP